ncbi:hypothetical protein [Rhodoferax sp.]|uniref:hypothetical protein n=1 Tax=Rhodoferax sp. TaxID=50421 RepID=UPI00276DF7CB|nr:hypothetical protein [Rhodoferax sp.]
MRNVVNLPATPAQDSAAHDVGHDVGATDGADTLAPPALPERSRGSRSNSRSSPAATAASVRSPFVPVLLGAVAVLGWLGFQTQQLIGERAALLAAHASLQQTVDNAGKLRASLDALAADTQRMADAGNPNAKLLVDELRKRGITINATSAGAERPASR